MDDLREKIAELVCCYKTLPTSNSLKLADRILAIPEIADALHAAQRRREMDATWHENKTRCDEAAKRLGLR